MWRRIKNYFFKNRSASNARERLKVVVNRDRNKQDSFLDNLRDEILQVCEKYTDVSDGINLDIQLNEGRLIFQGEVELIFAAEAGEEVNHQVG